MKHGYIYHFFMICKLLYVYVYKYIIRSVDQSSHACPGCRAEPRGEHHRMAGRPYAEHLKDFLFRKDPTITGAGVRIAHRPLFDHLFCREKCQERMKGSSGFLKFSTRFNFRSQPKALALLTICSLCRNSLGFSFSSPPTTTPIDIDIVILINPIVIYASNCEYKESINLNPTVTIISKRLNFEERERRKKNNIPNPRFYT